MINFGINATHCPVANMIRVGTCILQCTHVFGKAPQITFVFCPRYSNSMSLTLALRVKPSTRAGRHRG